MTTGVDSLGATIRPVAPVADVTPGEDLGNIIARWKYRAVVYVLIAVSGTVINAAANVLLFLTGLHVSLGNFPLYVGAASAAYVPIAAAVSGLALANGPKKAS
jgi:hypothetical protein